MPRRRFFVRRDQVRETGAVLTPDQAHHLRDVLRLRPGAEVELFDGEGLSWAGKIEFHGDKIHIGALRQLESTASGGSGFVVAPALIKADKFEWMLQKGTELGVDRFIPLETRFSLVRVPAARLASRMERWRRIVTEASKQCRRPAVPVIDKPVPWGEFLADSARSDCPKFLLYEKAAAGIPIEPLHLDRMLLCVGPEGGWDASEADAAAQAGFRLVSLGPNILRAETAALAAITVFQFLLNRHTTGL